MENNLENKEKFFAQYWGQNVLTRPHCGAKKWILGEEVSIQSALSKQGYDYQYFLELKPVSSITDEDALTYIGLGYNGYLNVIITEKHNDGVSFEYEYKSSKRRRTFSYRFNYVSQYTPNVAQLDFLRSKGYALPWMNLNIDTLEKYGWIKLKNVEL